jgi:hypothetical protein
MTVIALVLAGLAGFLGYCWGWVVGANRAKRRAADIGEEGGPSTAVFIIPGATAMDVPDAEDLEDFFKEDYDDEGPP